MKELFIPPDSYICVDLETTGLHPVHDRIIEIGAVKVISNKVTDTFQSLIDPDFRISDFIEGLTGITNDMLFHAPCRSEVIPEFLDFTEELPLIGHNIHSFDIKFLSNQIPEVTGKPFDRDYFDTLHLSRRLFPEERHHRLADLILRFGIAEREEHRALSDALQTVGCYNAMRRCISERGLTPDDLRPKQRCSRKSETF